VSRADEERIEDIIDAASEIAAVVAAGVDPDQVWTIATHDVPTLAKRLRRPMG
jgi:uncharacterized protein with HEPN domain